MAVSLDELLDSHRTGRAFVMGVLNVTPDSFSDGGRFLEASAAAAQARRMAAEGAEVIDVGAESTRPGAARVPAREQIARLREVLPAAVSTGVRISIDTTRSEVAAFALQAGATIINDVSAGRDDPAMFALAAAAGGAAMVLMHMRGQPRTMQADPQYGDVVAEVREFLRERLESAAAAGLPPERCIVDPGIGFGKGLEHNLALLGRLAALGELGRPVLVGPSRKRFIGELTGQQDPAGREAGTIAACLAARRRGATIFRVHDVAGLAQALAVDHAIEGAGRPPASKLPPR